MKFNKKITNAVTALLAVAVSVCACIIVCNHYGLVEEYDFGAGAYYYADIPAFEKVIDEDAFHTEIPVWVHILLFLVWGWLMYRLWCWIDRR